MAFTRRGFLTRVASGGGYAAAFTGMQALGLLPASAQASTLPDLPAGHGRGKRVIVLGAGVAGLVTALELTKAGFACIVLEARERPGGRSWTIRPGDRFEQTDGFAQTCHWEAGHYLNAGPARIPSIHTNLLGYCRQLGVSLEVEVNASRSALMQSPGLSGGRPVEHRQVQHDTRGYLSELLAKAAAGHRLDDQLSPDDIERMLAFLKSYGDLDDRYAYRGSVRAGWATAPGAGTGKGAPRLPLRREELLVADLSRGSLYEEQINWQATMLQPVGGMDRIPTAMARALPAGTIRYGAVVSRIGKTETGVRVTYGLGRDTVTIDADYCVCTLPLPVLAGIDTDFSPEHRAAFGGTAMSTSYKIAWESNRFWETEAHIYGGLSFPNGQPVDLVWYPSEQLFSKSGVLISGFGLETTADGRPTPFGALPDLAAKLSASRRAIETLHPGHGADLQRPLSVSWSKVPFSLGGWALNQTPAAQPAYEQLCKPDGRLIIAGDHASRLVSWQEGAVLSAHRAVRVLADHMRG